MNQHRRFQTEAQWRAACAVRRARRQEKLDNVLAGNCAYHGFPRCEVEPAEGEAICGAAECWGYWQEEAVIEQEVLLSARAAYVKRRDSDEAYHAREGRVSRWFGNLLGGSFLAVTLMGAGWLAFGGR